MRAAKVNVLAAIAVLSAAAACAETIQEAEDPGMAAGNAVFVRVENNHSLDMSVYAVTNGDLRVRLGTVTGFSTARFRIPEGVGGAADLRLLADPIGSISGLLTDRILVSPGDEIVWRLAEPLRVSSYTLRSFRSDR
jgi:hypothetical protein